MKKETIRYIIDTTKRSLINPDNIKLNIRYGLLVIFIVSPIVGIAIDLIFDEYNIKR